MRTDQRFFIVNENEIEQLAGAAGATVFKLPVRTREGDVFAIAFGATSTECVARARKIAAVDAMAAELEPTCTVLKTVATVLAQGGKMNAARALDDTYLQLLRVTRRAVTGTSGRESGNHPPQVWESTL